MILLPLESLLCWRPRHWKTKIKDAHDIIRKPLTTEAESAPLPELHKSEEQQDALHTPFSFLHFSTCSFLPDSTSSQSFLEVHERWYVFVSPWTKWATTHLHGRDDKKINRPTVVSNAIRPLRMRGRWALAPHARWRWLDCLWWFKLSFFYPWDTESHARGIAECTSSLGIAIIQKLFASGSVNNGGYLYLAKATR